MEPRFFNHGDPLDFHGHLAGLRGAISSTSCAPDKNYTILEPRTGPRAV